MFSQVGFILLLGTCGSSVHSNSLEKSCDVSGYNTGRPVSELNPDVTFSVFAGTALSTGRVS